MTTRIINIADVELMPRPVVGRDGMNVDYWEGE
jgi:hypothetical protein